jgi:hypothetical protein
MEQGQKRIRLDTPEEIDHFSSLPRNVIEKILSDQNGLSLRDIKRACAISVRFRRICQDKALWLSILRRIAGDDYDAYVAKMTGCDNYMYLMFAFFLSKRTDHQIFIGPNYEIEVKNNPDEVLFGSFASAFRTVPIDQNLRIRLNQCLKIRWDGDRRLMWNAVERNTQFVYARLIYEFLNDNLDPGDRDVFTAPLQCHVCKTEPVHYVCGKCQAVFYCTKFCQKTALKTSTICCVDTGRNH